MKLTAKEHDHIIEILKNRFVQNMHRHKTLDWNTIEEKLNNNPSKLWSLNEMEKTGGEPDVVNFDSETNQYFFYDCSKESPKERRSVCYDKKALESRKKFKPKNNACDMANQMGINLLTEKEYKALQNIENFDTKTSSWIKTPEDIRELGGALFADFRFNHVFIYHNGAESYYSARGFRGSLRI